MKIIATEEYRNKKFNLPEVGETQIPENGIIDVPEEVAKSLVDSNIGYSYVGNTETKSDTASDDVNDQFSTLSLEELVDLAKSAELPEEEWEKFAKNKTKAKQLMINYLKKRTT